MEGPAEFDTGYGPVTMAANTGHRPNLSSLTFNSARGGASGTRLYPVYVATDGAAIVCGDTPIDSSPGGNETGTRITPRPFSVDRSGVPYQDPEVSRAVDVYRTSSLAKAPRRQGRTESSARPSLGRLCGFARGDRDGKRRGKGKCLTPGRVAYRAPNAGSSKSAKTTASAVIHQPRWMHWDRRPLPNSRWRYSS